MDIPRRDFITGSLTALCLTQFLRLTAATKAYASSIAPEIESWVIDLEAIARDFRGGSLSLLQWHAAIESLNQRVPMPDLLARIKFDEIKPRLVALGRGEFFEKLSMPSISNVGRPFSAAIFSVTPGAQIPPHAHNNQVSAHLIVQGQLRTRTFERLHDEPGWVTVQPTRDELLGIGTTVTTSEQKENVHWFTAQSKPAFSFQISAAPPRLTKHVNVEERGGRVYLDLRGKPRSDGTMEAPVVDAREGHRLYAA